MNIKQQLRPYFARIADKTANNKFSHMVVTAALSSNISMLQQLSALFPHNASDDSYVLPAHPGEPDRWPSSALPIPPEPFWANYCTSVETYLQSGADDIDTMRHLLAQSGAPIDEMGRILEIGVAGGRLMRHLSDLAPKQEIWGVDVWSSAIMWCKEHLSPPFNFVTTTLTPHLPFEDRSFGLIYAGSVWTHLDDLAEAWALEAHRLLRPGGRLYFTINDRSAVKVFEGVGSPENRARYLERVRPDNWASWIKLLGSHAGYQRFARGEAQMVAIKRSTDSHVMWDADYLLKRLGPGWELCSITPEAYGHQTGVLLKRL